MSAQQRRVSVTNNREASMSRLHVAAVLSVATLLIAIACPRDVSAQSTPAPGAPAESHCTFTFGPPLRTNMLFAYRYQEVVKAVHDVSMPDGVQSTDSTRRVLTYFITERQVPSKLGNGAMVIEANIDSMRLDFTSPAGHLQFDTQKLLGTDYDVQHPEILVPSAVVNRLAKFTISPYGEILSIDGPITDVHDQVMVPGIDAFTRARAADLFDPHGLEAIFFPWHGALPLGRTVRCGEAVRLGAGTLLDRIPFDDSVEVTLPGDEDAPYATFTGTLTHPAVDEWTIDGLRDPARIIDADGVVSGRLNLDPDGVVVDGWTAVRGTVTSTSGDVKVRSTLTHEIDISRLMITNFPVD